MNRRHFLLQSSAFLSLPLWGKALLEVAEAQTSSGLPSVVHRGSSRPKSPWTANEEALVGDLSDLILPRSGTPGALDVGLPEFIFAVIAASPQSVQMEFRDGLKDFEVWIRGVSGQSFEHLPADQRQKWVNSLFGPTSVPRVTDWMKTLKLLSLYGYRNWSGFYNQVGLTTRYLGPEETP